MGRRTRWLALIVVILLVAGAVTLHRLPQIVRHVAVARIQALTNRPVGIDAVGVNVFTGRLGIRGLHIAERDGSAPFADIARLELRLRLLPLLLDYETWSTTSRSVPPRGGTPAERL